MTEQKKTKKTKLVPYVYTDFDGTITLKDLGDDLFKVYGQFEPYHSQLIDGKINIFEYWYKLCSTLSDDLDEVKIEEYAINCEIDKNFLTFADYCRNNEISLNIISDGFDAYINPLLKHHSIEWIKVFSNKLIFNQGQSPNPVFPFASESCKCLCASCKRNAMLKDYPEDAVLIYIGDGYSDFCAAEHSDIIFAKNQLAKHCNENKIPHYPFNNFFDVYKILSNVINKGQLKIRNQAQLLRKKSFETE